MENTSFQITIVKLSDMKLGKKVPFNVRHDIYIYMHILFYNSRKEMQTSVMEWISVFFQVKIYQHKMGGLAIYC